MSGGACNTLDAVYSTCVNSLIPSKTGKTPSQIKNQHRPLSAGQVQSGSRLASSPRPGEPAGLGPRQPGSPLVLPCGSALGVGPSPRHSAPAPGSRGHHPEHVRPRQTQKGHSGEVRVGGEGGCWPEEPGLSQGWLCSERPGAQQGEAASLGCVWRWGAPRGPTAPASCSHP